MPDEDAEAEADEPPLPPPVLWPWPPPVAIPAEDPVVREASVATAPPPRTTVVLLPTLISKDVRVAETLRVMVLMPVGSPAGIVATSGWLVTRDVSAAEPVRVGMPVTTPKEFVSVR